MDFSIAKNIFNQMAIKMAGFVIIMFLAFLSVYTILRFFKVPKIIAYYLGLLGILLVWYFVAKNNYFSLN